MEDFDVVPVFGIIMIICVVVFPIWIRFHYASRDRARLHETVRMMVEKGQPVSSELLESLNVAQNPGSISRVDVGKGADMRRGVTLVTVALAMIGLGVALYWVSDGYATGPIVGAAAFPGFIGIGFIIMAILNRSKTNV